MSDGAVLRLPVKRLDEGAHLPTYAHSGDAGLDLCCLDDHILQPFERALIPTGLAIAIEPGYAGLVVPRSGRAIKDGLSLVNTPGLIDSGYRGEVKVAAINLDPDTPIQLYAGDRIAQLVIVPFSTATLTEVDEFDLTERNAGGFGSSGG